MISDTYRAINNTEEQQQWRTFLTRRQGWLQPWQGGSACRAQGAGGEGLTARERSSTGTVQAAGACPHIHARSRASMCSAPTYWGYPAPGVPSSVGTAAAAGSRRATAPLPLGSWKETLQQGGAALFHPAIAMLLLEGKDTISIAFKCTYRKEHAAVTKSEPEHQDMVSAWDRYSQAAPGSHHL